MDIQMAVWIAGFSYPAVFLLLVLCGVGVPLSEELIILTGGLVVARSGASLPTMALAAYLGILAGDSALYRIGFALGPRVFSHPRLARLLPPARVELLQQLFARRGPLTVFFVRFLPGLRAPTFLLAGATRLPYRRFLLADGAAAWLPALGLTWLGFRYGSEVLAEVQGGLRQVLLMAGVVAVGAMALRWVRRRETARRTVTPGSAPAAEPVPVPVLADSAQTGPQHGQLQSGTLPPVQAGLSPAPKPLQ